MNTCQVLFLKGSEVEILLIVCYFAFVLYRIHVL